MHFEVGKAWFRFGLLFPRCVTLNESLSEAYYFASSVEWEYLSCISHAWLLVIKQNMLLLFYTDLKGTKKQRYWICYIPFSILSVLFSLELQLLYLTCLTNTYTNITLWLFSPHVLAELTKFFQFIVNCYTAYPILHLLACQGIETIAHYFPFNHASFFRGWPCLQESRNRNSDGSSDGDGSPLTSLWAMHSMYYVPTYYILHSIIWNIFYNPLFL